MLNLGETFPNFTAPSTLGDLNFYEYLGNNWGVVFSHPADYTPVIRRADRVKCCHRHCLEGVHDGNCAHVAAVQGV